MPGTGSAGPCPSIITTEAEPADAAVHAVSRRTRGPAIQPKLAQLLAQLLACGGPVILDAIAQLGDVAFDVELILLEPGDVEFLARGAAFQLAGDVFFVVADDAVAGWGKRNLLVI